MTKYLCAVAVPFLVGVVSVRPVPWSMPPNLSTRPGWPLERYIAYTGVLVFFSFPSLALITARHTPLIHFFHRLQYGSVGLFGTDKNMVFFSSHFLNLWSLRQRIGIFIFSSYFTSSTFIYDVHHRARREQGSKDVLADVYENWYSSRRCRIMPHSPSQFTSNFASFSRITLFMRLTLYSSSYIFSDFYVAKIGIIEALTCWPAEFWSLAVHL